MRIHLSIGAAILAAACATQPPKANLTSPAGQRDLAILSSFFTGTYQTIEQGAGEGDSSKVTLRQVEIWPGAPTRHWIYAEYSHPGEAAPFRQRVYRLEEEGAGRLVATTYDLPAPAARFAGEWRKAKPFDGLAPSDLRERAGCRMVFLRQGEITAYNGGTEGLGCPADGPGGGVEGPDYFVTSSSLRHWLRLTDRAGRVLPGDPGPWEFRRIAEKPM